MTSAPAPLARLELPSVEPSSTTITEGRYRPTAATRGAMVLASLRQVMTATHVVGSRHARSLLAIRPGIEAKLARQNQSNAVLHCLMTVWDYTLESN